MKNILILLITAMMSCTNSPEGSTNTEGSHASIRPDSTGDTAHTFSSDPGGGGLYSSDTMPGRNRRKGSDSNVLNRFDSASIRMNSGTKPQQ